jgi:hypothetical protein
MTAMHETKELASPAEPSVSNRDSVAVLCFLGESALRLWSLTPVERLRRQFAREGIDREISAQEARRHKGPVIFIRADAVLDQPLIPIVAKRPRLLLIGSTGQGARPLAVQAQGEDAEAIIDIVQNGRVPAPGLKIEARTPDQLDAQFW